MVSEFKSGAIRIQVAAPFLLWLWRANAILTHKRHSHSWAHFLLACRRHFLVQQRLSAGAFTAPSGWFQAALRLDSGASLNRVHVYDIGIKYVTL